MSVMSLLCSLAEARRFIFHSQQLRDENLSFEICSAGCRFYLSHLPFHLTGSREGCGRSKATEATYRVVKHE